jgi:hypothetical protein
VQRDSPVLFEPNEEANWPSGLTIQETLTTIKMGKSSIIDIPVSNTTGRDIVLPKRLELGRLQLVRSVTPLEVKLSDEGTEYQEESPADKSETSCKSNSNGPKESKVPEVDLLESKRNVMPGSGRLCTR